MTQQALADSAGITRQTVRMLEQGKGSAGALVKALGVLGHEVFPAPSNPRQHVSTLVARKVRKIEAPWTTPGWVLDAVLAGLGLTHFDLDPASPDPPHVPCQRYFTELDDGLAQPWEGGVVWCNPPYDAIPAWTNKLLGEFQSARARKVIALLPFTPDTNAFHRIEDSGAAIVAIRGRLRFGGREYSAPYPSVLCTWGVTEAEIDRIAVALEKARVWSYGAGEAVAA